MEITIQKAVTAHQEGRLEDAEKFYRAILQAQPNNLDANNNLGVLLQSLNRFGESEKCCKKTIELKPESAEPYYNLGIALEKLNRFDEAVVSYKKAIELKPDFEYAYLNLGNMQKKFNILNEAEKSYKKAIELKPDLAEAYNNLGNILLIINKDDEAIVSYKKAINLKPDYTEAYSNLGNILKKLKRFDEAISSYKKAIELKPNYIEAKHLLAALTGETTSAKTAPREYVENLFDEYAAYFDNSLIKKLEYKIPKVLTDMIVQQNPNISLGSILDLGCGTGLIGEEIKRYCTYIEGVDLSNSMLEKASTKNIYDKLTHQDVTDYLSSERLHFDYFISADVFVYIGDLSEVFRLIRSRNNSKGKFAFSTEHTDIDGFVLEKSGRYSHSKMYIESLCKKFDYKLSYFKKTDLRKDNEKFIMGGLYLLDF